MRWTALLACYTPGHHGSPNIRCSDEEAALQSIAEGVVMVSTALQNAHVMQQCCQCWAFHQAKLADNKNHSVACSFVSKSMQGMCRTQAGHDQVGAHVQMLHVSGMITANLGSHANKLELLLGSSLHLSPCQQPAHTCLDGDGSHDLCQHLHNRSGLAQLRGGLCW